MASDPKTRTSDDLQLVLEGVLGSELVWFQPPTNVTLDYPCVIFEQDNADTKFANNLPYSHTKRYQVTLIERRLDEDAYKRLAALPLCTFNRRFTTSNLYHTVFTLFF